MLECLGPDLQFLSPIAWVSSLCEDFFHAKKGGTFDKGFLCRSCANYNYKFSLNNNLMKFILDSIQIIEGSMETHFTTFNSLGGRISKNSFLVDTFVMERIFTANFMFLDAVVLTGRWTSQSVRISAFIYR